MLRIVSISCLLLLLSPLAGASSGILLETVNKEELSVDPGQVVTIALRINNSTDRERWVAPQWHLPAGWRTITSQEGYSLPANHTALKLFSLHIPSGTPAGFYDVKYVVIDTSTLEILATVSALVEVREIDKLVLTDLNGPQHVIAGKEIVVEFLLQNLGNMGRDIKLVTDQCSLEGSNRLYLEPGESRVIKVRADTWSELRSLSRKIVKLTALLKNDENTGITAIRQVKIIPRIEEKAPDVAQIPVSFQLRHLIRSWGQEGIKSGFQGEFFMAGSLDKDSRHNVELKLKGPNALDADFLGFYEEYYANYYNDKLYLFAGDKSFNSTPLTELSRFGRGTEFRIQSNGTEIGGFYMKPRFFPSITEELAGYIRFNISDENKLGFNVLRKKFDGEMEEAVIGSVTSSFKLMEKTWIDTELSSGNSEKGSGRGFGFRIFSTPTKRLQLNSNIMYASKYYPGYFTNTWNIAASANYQVSNKINTSVNFSQDDRNAARDTLFGASPFSKITFASINYQLMSNTSLRVQFRHHEIKDRMPQLKFHYLEKILKFELERQGKQFGATLTTELGHKENFLFSPDRRKTSAFRSFATASYQPSRRHSVELLLEYYQFGKSGEPADRQWIYGGRVNSNFSSATSLRLSFQNSYVIEEYYRNRSLFNLELIQKLGRQRNHRIALIANYVLLQRTEDETDFAVISNYTWNFGIRKGARKLVQGLHGTILKEGSSSVKGIVLYLNGQHAIADENGNFTFSYLPPGNYMLTLDPTSIDLHQVTTVPMPIPVSIEPNSDAFVTFGITEGATIKGKIDIEKDNRMILSGESQQSRKLIMLEITNGEETFRRIAAEDYSFEFPDIRPGQWHLRVINQREYEGFYFEQKSWTFDLMPGSQKDLTIRMLKKQKTIKFQQSLGTPAKGND